MKTQFQIQSKRINIHLTGAENGGTSVSLSSNLVEKVMRPNHRARENKAKTDANK